MSTFNKIQLNKIGDLRGNLVAIESKNSIPFEFKRAYYIYSLDEKTPRGFHAHRELKQFAVCVSGQCKIKMDNGKVKETVLLDNPAEGLVIGPFEWHEMFDFSHDCVLLVLASEHYDEKDYIRSYDEFLELIK
ncbi:FdtA/QdtA family cupin domain-containing protein [Ferrimonas sp. SCSIO 43195]|uniref:sugar 3,4-ketoisomerase n=1 Tax=Ferrimonas sp. SCSIO 43195 TaxID=2822844 RepID=UPI00207500AE|nr:FdtA/QdtA family cupin domain-containing protein [Ferrimonas sp. SCSIO 43195]USD38665.1 FdtA/QdtA family cupin domain-containing protein [Ferrimonas sp. SCSIO 43195]